MALAGVHDIDEHASVDHGPDYIIKGLARVADGDMFAAPLVESDL